MEDKKAQSQQPQVEVKKDYSQPVSQQKVEAKPKQPLEETSIPEKKKKLLPILVIVAVLLFGVVWYFAYQNLQSRKKDQVVLPEHYPIEAKPTESVADSTDDWETYTNTASSYIVRYPPDWKVESICTSPVLHAGVTYPCILSPNVKINKVPIVIEGSVIQILNQGDGDASYGLGESSQQFCETDVTAPVKSCERISVGGKEAYKKVFESISIIDVGILNRNGNIFMTLRGEYGRNVDTRDFEETFNKILSTFKFTN
jgi:hypothetical protein